MNVFGTWSIVVTDEIGQCIARRYEKLTAVQRERARNGEGWAVVREVLDEPDQEAVA